jgi:hypothetical protein
MTEPVSTSGGVIYGIAKFMIYIGLPASVAVTIVMAMTHPKSTQEWMVALISTGAASVYGGAFAIKYFELSDWAIAHDAWASLGGVYLVCGLPAWVLVRSFFLWADRNKARDLLQIASEIKKLNDNN